MCLSKGHLFLSPLIVWTVPYSCYLYFYVKLPFLKPCLFAACFSHFAELPLLFPVGACYLGLLPLRHPEFYLDIFFPPFLWPKSCITSWVPVLEFSADHYQTVGRTTALITCGFLYYKFLYLPPLGHSKLLPVSFWMVACLSVLSRKPIGPEVVFLTLILSVNLLLYSRSSFPVLIF